mgnify:FL=1|jgi:hypothetical protein|tara:strand:- start:261 stop:656 length:396 start_codon:yes stop_codon:yes gene_type:complete
MANVGTGTARQIIDSDGDVVGVTDNRLDVNATIGVGSSTFTSYGVVTQGTTKATLTSALSVTAVTTCKEIIFQALHDNAGYIIIKDSGDDAATEGLRLYAGDMLVLPVSSTDNISIDADQASQKVNVAIIT